MSDRPDDSDEIKWASTKHDCSSCDNNLAYTEEVFSLSVVYAQVTETGVVFLPLMIEDDNLYEPCMFCLDCWESDKEQLMELVEDMPPIEDDFAILECDICGSGIRQDETLGVCSFGEIHLSKRQPNGEKTSDTFQVMDTDPDIICVACLNKLDQEVVADLWDSRVAQNEECEEGTFARCWRHGCQADGTCIFSLEETG
jgi:hypothetical protein